MYILHRSSETQKFGATIEAWTLDQLTARGHPARPIATWTDSADLLIDGPTPLRIEVKAARRRFFWQRRPWGWERRARYSWEVGRIPRGDLAVILVAQDATGHRHPFIIPSWLILARSVSVIHVASEPAAYAARARGWLARFYEEWDTIGEVMAIRRRYAPVGQFTLWGEVV